MERSFLVISQKDFVKRLEEFIEEFERMDRSVEIVNFNTQWQINILNLSAEIDEFLKNAISNQLNDYRKIFHVYFFVLIFSFSVQFVMVLT